MYIIFDQIKELIWSFLCLALSVTGEVYCFPRRQLVKPKQTGSWGRGIRNEHMSNTNTILILNAMEQIQFIYIQDYMQYYTVHHKENSTYMEIWHRGWWFKLRHNCQFVLVLL